MVRLSRDGSVCVGYTTACRTTPPHARPFTTEYTCVQVRVLARIQCEDLCYKKKDANGQWVDQRFDCEKAHAIAIAILKDQHATGENRANRKSFRFDDYMGTQDNGTIPFTTFLDTVAIPPKGPWAPSEEDKERVKAAWEGAIRQQGNEANAKSERRNKFARMVSTVVASSTFAVSSDNI